MSVLDNTVTGITNATLADNPKLSNAINVLAYNTDRDGEEYVAIYEAKLYPFYATQFHPEAVAIGKSNSRVPDSPEARSIAYSMAEFFAEEASCSGQSNSTLRMPSVERVSQLAENVRWRCFCCCLFVCYSNDFVCLSCQRCVWMAFGCLLDVFWICCRPIMTSLLSP